MSTLAAVLGSLCLAVGLPGHGLAEPSARALVAQAIEAQGGEPALEAMTTVRLHMIVHRYAIEQSVRPEGPWFENFSDIVETRRLEPAALLSEGRSRGYTGRWWGDGDWIASTTLVTGGAAIARPESGDRPGSQALVTPAQESLALGPERLLMTAADAADLHRGPDAPLHGYDHPVVGFSWRGAPVKLYLHPVSHLPVAVEIRRPLPLDTFWSVWGEVTTRTEWDAWVVEPSGVRYPRRWTVFSNGQIERSVMIDRVETNPPGEIPPVDEAVIAAARESRRPIEEVPFTPANAIEIAPGITLFPGRWNVVQVVEPEGIYLIEAPLSDTYSAAVTALSRRQGKVAGVITTSDAWPHIGGLSRYAAEAIPILALDLNRPIIERLLKAREAQSATAFPVGLVTYVSESASVGSGRNAMRLLPFRSVTGERQMAVYWPALKLLYTSDLMSISSGSVWLPQYRDEVSQLIKREGLDVETAFGMHYGPTPWAEIRTLPGPPRA